MFKNVRTYVVCSFLNGHGSDGVEHDGLHLVVGAEQADQGLRHHSHLTREYCMIYRGLGFLAVIRLGFIPLPSAACLSFSVFLCVSGRSY
jgi:hypothetical protein